MGAREVNRQHRGRTQFQRGRASQAAEAERAERLALQPAQQAVRRMERCMRPVVRLEPLQPAEVAVAQGGAKSGRRVADRGAHPS